MDEYHPLQPKFLLKSLIKTIKSCIRKLKKNYFILSTYLRSFAFFVLCLVINTNILKRL